MAFRKLGFLALVFSLIQNILADALDQRVVVTRRLGNSSKDDDDDDDGDDYSGNILNVAEACYAGFVQSIPPSFCYKSPGDFGTIPTGCSSGYFRYLALCYKNCDSGYYFVGGVCWESCSSGYTNDGATCYKSLLHWYFKKSYEDSSYTNFDSLVTCDSGKYKSGALCYRDCGKVGLLNCGIGACAATTASCASTIATMAVDGLISLGQAVSFVVTFGADSEDAAAFDAARVSVEDGFKKLGSGSIDAAVKSFQAVLKREGTEDFLKDITDYAVKNLVKFTTTTVTTDVVTAVCNNVGNQLLNKTNTGSSTSINWQSFDPTGISGAVSSCKGVVTTNDKIACAQAVLQAVAFVDPTGLAGMAAAVMAPLCSGV